MINVCIIGGRFVRDPELNHTQNGTPVCRFTLAVDRPFANQDGQKQADFIDVIAWKNQAENVAKFMSKGRAVVVEGRLQIRSHDDSQGIRRKAAEVIANRVQFLPDGKKNGRIEDPPLPEEEPPFGEKEIPFNEDEIPF